MHLAPRWRIAVFLVVSLVTLRRSKTCKVGQTSELAIFSRVSRLGWSFAAPWPRRVSLGIAAILCCALAAAAVEEHQIGWNEHSHFAQVRAFDQGTPIIDRYRHSTGDRAIYKGHYYSDKAPGMGLLLTPAYHLIRVTGVVQPAGYGAIHLLVIVGCVIPLAIMLLLAYRMVARRDPEQAAMVAITLGLATLLLPFATVLFSHVLSACLGFAAFYLLWRERERGGGLPLIAAAGALAGFAVGTEYPMGLLAIVLGLYVAWRSSPVKPVLAYGAGLLVGAIPLLLYDWWAFGSPLHVSYQYVAANSSGLLGLGKPSLRNAVELLVSQRGMFVVTPVAAAGIAGMVLLYREGRRRDALVPALVFGAYFVYNACYYLPFGGSVPGPRFMITVLPFLAVPLAATYRRAPITTLSLAAVSAATMIAATITLPILSYWSPTRTWWKLLEAGKFGTHGITVAVFAVFVVLAIAAAVRTFPRPRLDRKDLQLAAVAVGGWLALARAAPALLGADFANREAWGLLAILGISIALTSVITEVGRGNRLAFIAAIPVVALAMHRFDRTTLTFCFVAASIGLLIVLAHRAARNTGEQADRATGPPAPLTGGPAH